MSDSRRLISSRIYPTLRALLLGSGIISVSLGFNLLQLLSMLLIPISRKAVFDLNSKLVGTVWRLMQYVFDRLDRAPILVKDGVDQIPDSESAIIISNHVSFVDAFLIHHVANRKNMLDACKYFAKDSLKYMPVFGWGMWMMGMIMIKRNWTQDRDKIDRVFSAIKTYKSPTWIVSYCEGTRMTKEKLLRSQEFARQRNLPHLKNVMIPRYKMSKKTKGFVATVQAFRDSSPCSPSTSYSSFLPPSSSRSSSFISNTCKSHIKAVYDFTLAYYHIPTRSLQINAPNILRMYTDRLDKEYAMGIKVRRYPLCELPYCSSSDVYNDDDDTAGRAGRSKHGSDLSHDLVELEVNVGKEKHRQHRDKPVEDDDEEEEDEDESTAILVKKKSIVHHPPLPSLSKREREAEALAAWLVQRFKEKDEFISEFGRQMDQRFLIKNG